MTEQPYVARFTPGPWLAIALMVKAGHETVVHTDISNSFSPPRPQECAANARLIAAAPELYEALLDARRRLAHIAATCGLPNAIEACRLNVREAQTARDAIDAALAKAVPRTVASDDATAPNTDPSPNQTADPPPLGMVMPEEK